MALGFEFHAMSSLVLASSVDSLLYTDGHALEVTFIGDTNYTPDRKTPYTKKEIEKGRRTEKFDRLLADK